MLYICLGAHIHVGACMQSLFASLFQVLGGTMLQYFGYAGIVGYEHAVKSPAVSQHVGHHPSVGSGWHVVDEIEG